MLRPEAAKSPVEVLEQKLPAKCALFLGDAAGVVVLQCMGRGSFRHVMPAEGGDKWSVSEMIICGVFAVGRDLHAFL